MNEHSGQCSCGQLRILCKGDPVRISICHCLACQRRTGAPFGEQARWPAEQVTVEGAATLYKRVGDSGSTLAFRFCATCGATVYFEIEQLPGFVGVPVGVFADPSFGSPIVSVYETHKHNWVHVPEAIAHLD